MPPEIILQPGTKVQIQWPWLREHGSYGTITSYEADTGWYYVQLDRKERAIHQRRAVGYTKRIITLFFIDYHI